MDNVGYSMYGVSDGRGVVFLVSSYLNVISHLCILGGQQPAGQQSRSKDYRTAQEEQFLPLHAPVRRREHRHPPSP